MLDDGARDPIGRRVLAAWEITCFMTGRFAMAAALAWRGRVGRPAVDAGWGRFGIADESICDK